MVFMYSHTASSLSGMNAVRWFSVRMRWSMPVSVPTMATGVSVVCA